MNEIFLNALAKRINAEPPQMTIEQVPEMYREQIIKIMEAI